MLMFHKRTFSIYIYVYVYIYIKLRHINMPRYGYNGSHFANDVYVHFMMTSSNRNTFRVTGPLCVEFTGDRWIPLTKASDTEFDVFFDLRLNKRLSKQSRGWWFETPSHPLWRHCNVLYRLRFHWSLFQGPFDPWWYRTQLMFDLDDIDYGDSWTTNKGQAIISTYDLDNRRMCPPLGFWELNHNV